MISSLTACLELNIALHNMYERNQRPSKFCSRLWHSTTIPPRHQTTESVRFCFFLRSVLLTDDMLGKVKKWLHLSRKQQRNVNNAETFLRRIRKLVSTFPWRNKAAISSKIAGFMELENSCQIAIAFTCMTTTKVKVPHYESDFFFLFYFRFFKGLPLTIWEICLDRSTRSFRLLQMDRTSIVPQSNTARYLVHSCYNTRRVK